MLYGPVDVPYSGSHTASDSQVQGSNALFCSNCSSVGYLLQLPNNPCQRYTVKHGSLFRSVAMYSPICTSSRPGSILTPPINVQKGSPLRAGPSQPVPHAPRMEFMALPCLSPAYRLFSKAFPHSRSGHNQLQGFPFKSSSSFQTLTLSHGDTRSTCPFLHHGPSSWAGVAEARLPLQATRCHRCVPG